MTSQRIADLLEILHVRATIMLGIATYMMIDVARWGMLFAVSSGRDGAGVAAILVAAQAPATFFAGWVFKLYVENRSSAPN